MARIRQVRFEINRDPRSGKYICEANCDLIFTNYEVNEMEEGLTFRLSGDLMGSDWYIYEQPEAAMDRIFRGQPRDKWVDRIAPLPSQTVTGSGERTRTVTLSKEFSRRELDEDSETERDAGRDESFVTTTYDELYVHVKLLNNYTHIEVTRTSNVFKL